MKASIMKQKIITNILLSLVFFTYTAQAEMKCSTGKCSANKKLNKEINKTTQKKTITKQTTSKEITTATKNKARIKQLFNVKTVKVKTLSVSKKQLNYGYITAVESHKIDVVAWYSGFVEILYANTLYKKVKKGDALVKIYSPEVYKAKQDYVNSIKFNKQHSSPGMLRGAKAKLKLLNVCAREIEAIEKTRTVEEYTTIYSPLSGWIFMKSLNEGSSIKKQAKLFEIINLDEVWMEAKIYQKELALLDRLENFSVTVEGIEESYDAHVEQLYPMMNPKEATATLRLLLDNSNNKLLPGMYAKLHASASEKISLLIPRTAAMRKNGKWYVFLVTQFEGEYEPLQVELEPLDTHSFIVKKGLKAGDSVVNNALFMMDSDAQINSIY